METFGNEKDQFEINEIEVEEGNPLRSSSADTDEIHKNLNEKDPQPKRKTTHASQEEEEISYEWMTNRERRRMRKIERRINRRRQRYVLKAQQRSKYHTSFKKKKKKYHWAFFLSFTMLGLASYLFIDPHGAPFPIFFGMGIGFLFFVDPIYQKVISKIENL